MNTMTTDHQPQGITVTRMFGPWDVQNFRNAVASKSVRARDMGSFYADCIRADSLKLADVDWLELNSLILARWAPSTLQRIKRDAWSELRP